MKVYIIDSSITGKAVKESSVFQKELIEQLAIYGVDYSVIYNQNIERCKLNMQKDSLIIVFNLDSRINMTRLVPQLRVLHKSQPA